MFWAKKTCALDCRRIVVKVERNKIETKIFAGFVSVLANLFRNGSISRCSAAERSAAMKEKWKANFL